MNLLSDVELLVILFLVIRLEMLLVKNYKMGYNTKVTIV